MTNWLNLNSIKVKNTSVYVNSFIFVASMIECWNFTQALEIKNKNKKSSENLTLSDHLVTLVSLNEAKFLKSKAYRNCRYSIVSNLVVNVKRIFYLFIYFNSVHPLVTLMQLPD